jgi:hypothetical protein
LRTGLAPIGNAGMDSLASGALPLPAYFSGVSERDEKLGLAFGQRATGPQLQDAAPLGDLVWLNLAR